MQIRWTYQVYSQLFSQSLMVSHLYKRNPVILEFGETNFIVNTVFNMAVSLLTWLYDLFWQWSFSNIDYIQNALERNSEKLITNEIYSMSCNVVYRRLVNRTDMMQNVVYAHLRKSFDVSGEQASFFRKEVQKPVNKYFIDNWTLELNAEVLRGQNT